ncbi:hypothetical protein B0H11DRAFT_1008842 [Mycena galericulata]|nr:hypothetical protein B0H11DRAFT_1008842 [Mycena galericulata]
MLMRHLDALTPILFWALSALIPNTYLGLGALTASLLIQAAHRCRPSVRLGRLNTAITETLTRAKSTCAWAHLALVENERCLLQAELGASKVQTRGARLRIRTRAVQDMDGVPPGNAQDLAGADRVRDPDTRGGDVDIAHHRGGTPA